MEHVTDNKPTAEMNGKEEKPFFSLRLKVLLLIAVAILGAALLSIDNAPSIMPMVLLFCGAGALLYGIPTGITVWKKFTAEKKYTRLTVWLICQIALIGYILWVCGKVLRNWLMA